MGIETSTEIQGAARKVVEENRKLRAMLLIRGVPEIGIAAALTTEAQVFHEHTSAVPTLMSMLDVQDAYVDPK